MAITGRAVLLLALGAVLVVLRPELSSVYYWAIGVAALVLLDAVLAPSPRRLAITREPTLPVRLHEPAESVLLVANEGRRRLRGVLRDAWQPTAGATANRHRLNLPAGERARLVTPLLPARRGDLRTDRITVRSPGPLGLAARQTGFDCPGVVVTLPAFPSRKHLPSRLAKLQQIEGSAVARNRGEGTEFDSLRDYVDGDDVRSIDWRATGRRKTVVVRTWRPERERRILIVLDTSRVSAARVGDTPRLDSAMDAALLLGALAARAEDHVSFLAGDRIVRSQVAGVTRRDVIARLSEAMARLEPALLEADWTELGAAMAKRGRRQSLLVLLTPLEPAAVEETLFPVLSRLAAQQRVVLASVADPELDGLAADRSDSDAAHLAAAAEQTREQRIRLAEALAGVGVTVLDEPPDALPTALVDHYLALKSRGLL